MSIEKKKYECSALPKGWQREEVIRKSGLSAGKVDVYYYSRGVRNDASLVPPIRQTASIFKQPVTVYKTQEGKVKTDFKHGPQEKPKQAQTTESAELNSQSGATSPPYPEDTETSEPILLQEKIPTNDCSKPLKRNSCTLAEEVLLSIKDYFTYPQKEDRFDMFGKHVGMKLRGLPNNQRILAEKRINEILFSAEMGQLFIPRTGRKK
ncbi:methyl-CpG-binding domain protein 1 isoform X3 [Periplaneta americana]|uniref:methyl-CpG-binding domain protein 1 isoform X3 n=1 Tax=Periplaneta americana TaxID=6978 RepID=UPI0037E8D9BD